MPPELFLSFDHILNATILLPLFCDFVSDLPEFSLHLSDFASYLDLPLTDFLHYLLIPDIWLIELLNNSLLIFGYLGYYYVGGLEADNPFEIVMDLFHFNIPLFT